MPNLNKPHNISNSTAALIALAILIVVFQLTDAYNDYCKQLQEPQIEETMPFDIYLPADWQCVEANLTPPAEDGAEQLAAYTCYKATQSNTETDNRAQMTVNLTLNEKTKLIYNLNLTKDYYSDKEINKMLSLQNKEVSQNQIYDTAEIRFFRLYYPETNRYVYRTFINGLQADVIFQTAEPPDEKTLQDYESILQKIQPAPANDPTWLTQVSYKNDIECNIIKDAVCDDVTEPTEELEQNANNTPDSYMGSINFSYRTGGGEITYLNSRDLLDEESELYDPDFVNLRNARLSEFDKRKSNGSELGLLLAMAFTLIARFFMRIHGYDMR